MLTYKLKLFNDTDEKVGYCQNIIINIRHFPYPRVICPCNNKKLFHFEHLQNHRNFAQLTASLFMDGF